MRSVLFVGVAILALQASAPAMAFNVAECGLGLIPASISCVSPTANDRNGDGGNEAEASAESSDSGEGEGGGKPGKSSRPGHGKGDKNHDHDGPPGRQSS